MAPSALRQLQVLADLKASRTPAQQKISSRLLLGLLHDRGDPRLAALPDFRFIRPQADGKLALDVVLKAPSGAAPVAAKVSALGGSAATPGRDRRHVAARARLGDLEALAAMPEVHRVREQLRPRIQAVNVSEGATTHGAEEARHFFGADGSGVKVCAISDGVNSLAALQASGDLPQSVAVLPGQTGSGDEGSAMLEIIHDLALFSSLNPSRFGVGVTFTASVAPAAATGLVSFEDDGAVLATANLINGVATVLIDDLNVAIHPMTARYAGDTDHATSTSAVLSQEVRKTPTGVALTSRMSPAIAGTPVTLSAEVTPAGATGLVVFEEGATTLGVGLLSVGVATLTVSTLSVGTHSIVAVYLGSPNFFSNGSDPLAQVVSPPPLTATQIAVASSDSSSTFGDSISLTATVTPGGATGSVSFFDGAAALGSVALSGGTATLAISTLGGGQHAITATYGGDPGFLPSASAAATQDVAPATTVAALRSSSNPAAAGQPIDFAITVSSTAGEPEGTSSPPRSAAALTR